MASNAVAGTITYNAVVNTSTLQSGLDDANSKLGSAAKGTALAVAGIAAAGIAAVGSLTVASVKAYSDYQQYTGGVEKLFGDNAKTVEDFANQAYQTAGLSANQYLDTVTSFSASLISGLGGNTAAAAQEANKAIVDMSDNANVFGTDIGSIQYAYQGFAKQNYTMLDNLKLGFGGTADGMAQLVNQSGVLGQGVTVTAETIKNVPFDKIVDAIHQVQVNMGIAGDTAAEAADTIQGSFNSVKSSWENVLTAFGTGNNDQIQMAIGGLIEGAKNLLTNVVTILPGIITGLGGALIQVAQQLPAMLTILLPPLLQFLQTALQTVITVLPQLIPLLLGVVNSLVQTIIKNLPAFINAAVQIVVAIVTGIAQEAPTLIPQIIAAIQNMELALIQQLPLLLTAGIQLIVALVQGLATAMPQIIAMMPVLINALIVALTNPPMIILLVRASLEIILALAKGIIQAIPQLIGVIPQVISGLVSAIAQLVPQLVTAGGDLVVGLWNGIWGKKDWIINQIKSFGKAVLDGLKSFFGIHSPSTIFRDQIGKNLALGIGEGFTGTIADVTKDMNAAMPSSNFDIKSVASTSSGVVTQSPQPVNLTVQIGEAKIANTLIKLINEKTLMSGHNTILV